MYRDSPTKNITVSFFGGVEEIMGCRKMKAEIKTDIRKITQFIKYMHDEVLKDNPKRDDLLIDDKTVRPGILVLHNNRDINLFTQAEEDDADGESDSEDQFRFHEAFGIGQSTTLNAKPPQPQESKKEKLRIEDGDEITFLSIIHGG
uniref:Ubiquitin-related modifier 1 n=1 Tax=Panagrolaimus sp. ES5 TaxID=591445 RepID=A0AC34FEV2_9BILA